MRVNILLGTLVWIYFLGSVVGAPRGRGKADSHKPTSKLPPKPALKLNVDILPPLQDVLKELNMESYLRSFVKMGVTETRLLLKLSAMDFQIMTMDWENFGQSDVTRLKSKIADLLVMATVPEEITRPELEARNKVNYGRIFLQNGVAAMEYAMGSFGSPAPLGQQRIRLSKSIVECEDSLEVDYGGDIVLAQRGNCSFLAKALVAKSRNAAGIIIVNTEDRLDHPASGLGIDSSVKEATVQSLDKFFVAGMSNTSWEPLTAALRFSGTPFVNAHIVPIKCQTGGKCLPLLEEERALQAEVSWGRLRARNAGGRQTFDFLTSTFGAPLPVDVDLPVMWADPVDACSEVANVSETQPFVMVAHRGKCKFDAKALHAQRANARLLVVVDAEDEALQRIGAMVPEVGFVGIPSVLVTAEAGKFLSGPAPVVARFEPAADQSAFEYWLEVAYTQWSEESRDRLMQLQGLLPKFQALEQHDIVSWLQRRVQEIENANRKAVETDEL